MNDLWNRLYRVVNHMAERLADPENKFKNSLVDNIVDLCDLLPRLNITSDPKLEKALLEVRQKLTAYDSQTLRDSNDIRSQTALEAQKILDKMKHYLPAA